MKRGENLTKMPTFKTPWSYLPFSRIEALITPLLRLFVFRIYDRNINIYNYPKVINYNKFSVKFILFSSHQIHTDS